MTMISYEWRRLFDFQIQLYLFANARVILSVTTELLSVTAESGRDRSLAPQTKTRQDVLLERVFAVDVIYLRTLSVCELKSGN